MRCIFGLLLACQSSFGQWVEFEACGRAFPPDDFGDYAYQVIQQKAPNVRSYMIRAETITAVMEPRGNADVKVEGLECVDLFTTGRTESGFFVVGSLEEVLEKIDRALEGK